MPLRLALMLLALALGLASALWLARRLLRRWIWRAAVRMRRRTGVRLNLVTVTRKQKLKAQLLEDERLRAFVRAQVEATGAREGDLLAQVAEYLDEIIPSFNLLTTYAFGRRLAGGLLRAFYRIRVGRSAEAELNAIPRNASVVYVMNHRSNADYLLVAFLLSDRVAISYAVGEWARVWPLERLFKSFGAFFIRRKYRDPLYHAVLERYVQRAVEGGVTQGIFLEGGLSRDGRLQPPKLGLLDYMLRSGAKELVFIPVGLNYDRVLEDSNLVREAEGRKAHGRLGVFRRSAFWLLGLLWRGARGRFQRFGYAVANFGPPIRARDLLQGADPGALSWEARKPILEAATRRLMAAVSREVPLTPVAVVAFAWRRLGRASASRGVLEAEARRWMELAESRGLPLYLTRGGPDRVLDLGLRVLVLRGVLQADAGGVELTEAPERGALLDYYAHGIAHHFGA
ncbi:MAG TPA: 1-acyl-sn-glycerol-3-phosphate acyltransferase [Holophagaceae bacterium]|nr:1-acyl-sn-glycerol-3-phosphate acyltransferase [Holophagaceae bacterium]